MNRGGELIECWLHVSIPILWLCYRCHWHGWRSSGSAREHTSSFHFSGYPTRQQRQKSTTDWLKIACSNKSNDNNIPACQCKVQSTNSKGATSEDAIIIVPYREKTVVVPDGEGDGRWRIKKLPKPCSTPGILRSCLLHDWLDSWSHTHTHTQVDTNDQELILWMFYMYTTSSYVDRISSCPSSLAWSIYRTSRRSAKTINIATSHTLYILLCTLIDIRTDLINAANHQWPRPNAKLSVLCTYPSRCERVVMVQVPVKISQCQ